MSNKDDRWSHKLHKVGTLRLKKDNKSYFPNRSNKIKQVIRNLKQQRMDRKIGAKVRDVRYTKASTGETVHAEYEIRPVIGVEGLYQIQEYIISDIDFQKLQYAKEHITNEEERKNFIKPHEIQELYARVMYATIDYKVIQQLRMDMGVEQYEDARENFKKLVEHQRIKQRIMESKDKEARAIYQDGKSRAPRVYGYIGGIVHTLKGDRRVYDLRDKRARRINKIVFDSLKSKTDEGRYAKR